MFLKIEDIVFHYGKLEVLKGVSMDIPEGEINVLLGANGSGKSTLLKTISGVRKPVSGSIWFKDKKIDRLTPPDRLHAGIAHIAEGRGIFPNMTVIENMELGAYIRSDKKAIARDIEAMFTRFPVLAEKRGVMSGKLSGGQQQLLVIARALMNSVKLLLLDEPSQGLAPLVVNEVADIITEINKSGVTVILVEHNLRLGLSIANRVFVLESGKIAFESRSTDMSGVEYAKKIYLGG